MTVKEAVVARFLEICAQRNIKPNELANSSGITPSTVYSMLDARRKELSINVIKKLCDGLDMTLGEFFNAKVFDELEQEIR
ncbi:MAG: helix-turn-helix transcriptional regulator [Clostridiales bacterium]|jgi:DNA-binding Xre family transcriptional regulator|nr:helix-turn-helix transcriptional regulator [Clostridiales bacterium]